MSKQTDFTCSKCSAAWRKSGSTNCWSSNPDNPPAKPGNCPTRDHADIIMESFELYKGDAEDARMAIVTAAKSAAKKQRHSMVRYLQSMAADLEKVSPEPESKPYVDSFIRSSKELAEEISSKEWEKNDIESQKEELGKINPDYLTALENADPTIFTEKHPQLFRSKNQ